MNTFNAEKVISNAPDELKKSKSWVAYITKPNGKKIDKIPINAITGALAKTNDPNTWTDLDTAINAAIKNNFAGVGYVLQPPYIGIDQDNCITGGKIQSSSLGILKKLKSYSEISPSGKGIHTICKGQLKQSCKLSEFGIEVYTTGRFFTFTGDRMLESPAEIAERTSEIAEVISTYTTEKQLISTAMRIVKKISNSRQAEKFNRLFNGKWEGYVSQSEADLALCRILAYWTNNDVRLIDVAFRRSGLYREKWDKVHHSDGKTYGQGTIEQAIGSYTTVTEQREYNLTDLGNAERLTSSYSDRLRYCHQFRKWLVWNGKFWEIDAVPEVYQLAATTVRNIYAEAMANEEKGLRAKIAQHALKSESEARIRAMVSLAEKQKGIPVKPEQLDKNPWLLNVLNGTMDLRTMTLKPHTQEDLITKLAPVNFNPEAACPKWIDFLRKITLDNQYLIRFLQRIMGYCLTGKTGEHKLFFFYGSGANGKTTFIKTKQGIMGNYAIKTDSELLISKPAGAHSTDRADLKGCRLAITVEIQEGRHLAEAIVKELTGGDSITARKLYENNQTFEPTHKIILAANHKPLIYETTNALWRRIDLIPFNYFFSEDERVKDYHDVLLNEERDGIFRWALEGCLEWRKIGLKEPPEVLAATKDYKTESDILEDFIADCCDIDPAVEVGNKDLRKVYDKWCHDNGEKEISAKAFSQRLQEKGYKKEKSGSKGRYWRGIGLKEDVPV